MEERAWIGKSISIHCNEGGVFQGIIKEVTPDFISITRAFRNGVPVSFKKPNTEVKIASTNILNLEIIPDTVLNDIGTGVAKPTPIKHPSLSLQTGQSLSDPNFESSARNRRKDENKTSVSPNERSFSSYNNGASSSRQYSNKSPQQQHSNNKKFFANSGNPEYGRAMSKPIDILNAGNSRNNTNMQGSSSGNNNLNGKKSRRYNKNETFGTPVNDMDEDFDFEKNLALFDKQAIWHKIENSKPDLLHQTNSHPRKYRHDELVISSEPTVYRQIEVDYNSSRDYVTDDGLIIPSIPLIVRNRVQTAAEAMGLRWERQIDILSRGTTDIALQILGGSRRLKPTNQHQWPVIVVVCEEPYNERKSEIGICTGRILATHGLKVNIYVKEMTYLSRMSHELDLFKSTGNEFTNKISELPSNDLIIISARTNILSPDIVKWITECRSPVLAIDPPVNGFMNIQAKCSILPILPLDDINSHALGKLYLCNLGIPDKFFHDAGIKYKSPFGHKYVIPISVD